MSVLGIAAEYLGTCPWEVQGFPAGQGLANKIMPVDKAWEPYATVPNNGSVADRVAWLSSLKKLPSVQGMAQKSEVLQKNRLFVKGTLAKETTTNERKGNCQNQVRVCDECFQSIGDHNAAGAEEDLVLSQQLIDRLKGELAQKHSQIEARLVESAMNQGV